jgi:hypothetical protein
MNSNKLEAPVKELQDIVSSRRFIGEKIDFDVLDFLGVFVLKNAFKKETIDFYSSAYFKKDGLEKVPFHLTQVQVNPNHVLNGIIKEAAFLEIVSDFFNGNVGNDCVRIFKKDSTDTKPVFLHQDISYMMGGFERYSLFISLSDCDAENGSLIAYPGTHHFGYLGDAGEISESILPTNYPKIVTNTKAGDIFIMHSAVWHGSPENKNLKDRVYLEVKIQDANDSTTRNVLCGTRNAEWGNLLTPDEIFKNSRTQRLKQFYQQVEDHANKSHIEKF